jgi:hypothetical protein
MVVICLLCERRERLVIMKNVQLWLVALDLLVGFTTRLVYYFGLMRVVAVHRFFVSSCVWRPDDETDSMAVDQVERNGSEPLALPCFRMDTYVCVFGLAIMVTRWRRQYSVFPVSRILQRHHYIRLSDDSLRSIH